MGFRTGGREGGGDRAGDAESLKGIRVWQIRVSLGGVVVVEVPGNT